MHGEADMKAPKLSFTPTIATPCEESWAAMTGGVSEPPRECQHHISSNTHPIPAQNYPRVRHTQTMTAHTNPIDADIARKKRSKHAQKHGISSHNSTFISCNQI